jgi:hypothetical protein
VNPDLHVVQCRSLHGLELTVPLKQLLSAVANRHNLPAQEEALPLLRFFFSLKAAACVCKEFFCVQTVERVKCPIPANYSKSSYEEFSVSDFETFAQVVQQIQHGVTDMFNRLEKYGVMELLVHPEKGPELTLQLSGFLAVAQSVKPAILRPILFFTLHKYLVAKKVPVRKANNETVLEWTLPYFMNEKKPGKRHVSKRAVPSEQEVRHDASFSLFNERQQEDVKESGLRNLLPESSVSSDPLSSQVHEEGISSEDLDELMAEKGSAAEDPAVRAALAVELREMQHSCRNAM